jgi:hypothetical protein
MVMPIRPTFDRLREVLDYDATTGLFIQKIATGHRSQIGAVAGHAGPGGRWVISIDKKAHYATQLAWFWTTGEWPSDKLLFDGEHGPSVPFAKLRLATQSEIVAASKINSLNTSGIKGVSWQKAKAKWVAMITRDGTQYYLGNFDTKEAAAAAYEAAAAGGPLPERGSKKDANWKTARRQRSAPWAAIQENPQIVGWPTLEQFVAAHGEPPTEHHVLMRSNYSLQLGPGNAEWRLPWAKRAGHEANPRKSYNLMKFEISLADYDRLIEQQEGVCAICHLPESIPYKSAIRRLAVDHDHRTGNVRGLLCGRCNQMIGYAQDNPDVLEAAAAYLRAHAAEVVPFRKDSA